MLKSESEAVMNVKYMVNKREDNLKNVGLEELKARLSEIGKTESDNIDDVLGVEKSEEHTAKSLADKLKIWLVQLNQKFALSIDEGLDTRDARGQFFDKFYDAKTPAARVIHMLEAAIHVHKAKRQQEVDNVIRSKLARTLAEPSPPPELGVFITAEKIKDYMNSRR